MLKKIKKRDGSIVDFDSSKIENVIWKAVQAVGGEDSEGAKKLAAQVAEHLEQAYGDKKIPSVEDVQDMVEKVLIENGHSKTAKAFILYRKKRQELREAKSALGIDDDMKLSFDALRVMMQYGLLKQKEDGNRETPKQMFERTAKALSKADKKFDEDAEQTEKKFTELMINLELLPSTVILANAGTTQQLSEGFVLPLEDDILGLFETLKQAAALHKRRQHGFGLGLSFSSLRSKGSAVGQSGFGERAGGPVSFLMLYERALSQINPHGTNLAFLSVHHPDIIDFITAKENLKLKNFGTSVLLTRGFMKAVEEDKPFKLIDPHTQQAVTTLRARSVMDMIATIAWRTGDPAIVFLDNLNKAPANPFEHELITATTATGEHPLFPYESCFTASINLTKHIKENDFDWEKLKNTVHEAVHMLDNAIEVCAYPSAMMKRAMEQTRRIGIGVMGWADVLIALEMPYNSEEELQLAQKIMKFVSAEAKEASTKLAKQRGNFEGHKESPYVDEKMRNASRTTIIHSGILSIIAGCSQGIEPYYAIGYLKRTPTAETFEVIQPFEEVAEREGFHSAELIKTIVLAGSVSGVKEVPVKWRKIFVTAQDCTIDEHLAVQIAFQKYTDNGVSKTINLPTNATIHEVEEIFTKAYAAGCKSVHIYREGSSEQLLYYSTKKKKKAVV